MLAIFSAIYYNEYCLKETGIKHKQHVFEERPGIYHLSCVLAGNMRNYNQKGLKIQ